MYHRSSLWRWSLLVLLFLSACRESVELEQGVSEELARFRLERMTDISYELTFLIPEQRNDSIPARQVMSFRLSDVPEFLPVDFQEPAYRVLSVRVNGDSVPVRVDMGHILLPGKNLNKGENRVDIRFAAGEGSLNRNDEYLYTLLVPDRASTCFPVFDQPDLKASYRLILEIPSAWQAVSNGKAVSEESLAESRKRITFDKVDDLSTYQFAFAAGRFRRYTDPDSVMTLFCRESDSLRVARNLPRIFELHRHALQRMKEYTGISYPYAKLDFALLPPFQYGGMEHPGSIFYKESSLLLEADAPVTQELSRASLIAHEVAHMWFGNLVTMRWFNDVWMKEVFANVMASKIVHPDFPTIDHRLRFLLGHFPSAYTVDRTAGANPVRQQLGNLRYAGTMYGSIIYQKAPVMMRNLEEMIGADAFRKGLQAYLNKYAYGNADWDELLAVMQEQTQESLDPWDRSWIKSPGMPVLDMRHEGDSLQLELMNSGSGNLWPQESFVHRYGPDGDVKERIAVRMRQTRLGVRVTAPKPDELLVPNADGHGYGYFRMDSARLPDLIRLLPRIDSARYRAAGWMAVWEETLHGRIHPDTLISGLISALALEKDPLVWDYLSGMTNHTFWLLLPARTRIQRAPMLESALLGVLRDPSDIPLRRMSFDLFRSVSLTDPGREVLEAAWNGSRTFGMQFSETDRIQLALALALRSPSDREQWLDRQMAQIKNPDRLSRFRFVRQALQTDASGRDDFFESLENPENRSREPWVTDALSLLHHPLQGSDTRRYLPKALELLEEVQQTGDIFFPQGWLQSNLYFHHSDLAVADVQAYLDSHPDLPRFLRLKVLQSADIVERSNRIRRRYYPTTGLP